MLLYPVILLLSERGLYFIFCYNVVACLLVRVLFLYIVFACTNKLDTIYWCIEYCYYADDGGIDTFTM